MWSGLNTIYRYPKYTFGRETNFKYFGRIKIFNKIVTISQETFV
jgi:hypothetical protein